MAKRLLSPLTILVLLASGCTYVDPVDPSTAPVRVFSGDGLGGGGGVTKTAAANPAIAAGSVVGTLRGPAAGLVANNAASLVSNNAGSLVSNNAGSLVSNNAAGLAPGKSLISQDGGSLAHRTLLDVQAMTSPVANVAVALYDDQGHQVSSGSVLTDADGNYRFTDVTTSSPVLFVRAHYEQEGHAVDLAATASVPRRGEEVTVPVDPTTTLVAKKVDTLLQAHEVTSSALNEDVIGKMVQGIAPLMTEKTVVAAAILPADQAASTFDALVSGEPQLQLQLHKIGDTSDDPPTPAEIRAASSHAATVKTVAGGDPGYADGTGPDARFNGPYDVAADLHGNLYVSDYGNHCLRKLDPTTGQVTTIAGSPTPGYVDGAGPAARFCNPRGMVFDGGDPSHPTLYVVDAGNARIRKVSLDIGQNQVDVETIAGTGEIGYADGAGREARFKDPHGIATDGHGHLYVADTGNRRVRMIDLHDPAHAVTTVADLSAGDVPAGQLAGPWGLAIDARGATPAIFVSDASTDAVLALGADLHAATTIAGGTQGDADGTGLQAQFRYPGGMALDATGRLVVADMLGHMLRRVDGNGRVTTIAGNGTAGTTDGAGDQAEFQHPTGLAFGADGRLYVADTENHRIRAVTLP